MLRRILSTNGELVPWIVIGGALLCTVGAFAVYNSFFSTLPAPTPTPDSKATMVVIQETVAAEATAHAQATPCPAPEGPFYDWGVGRSYVPLWTYWEGRGVTVTSRGASYQFSLDPHGVMLVLPLGAGSSFTTMVSSWDPLDPNQDKNLVQVFRLTNAQGENAGEVIIYFCPGGAGQYMSDVLYP